MQGRIRNNPRSVDDLRAPFPYFGGKSRVAHIMWEHLGDVDVYIEPFAGSLAVLLARPHPPKVEIANDYDGLIVNVWRAIKHAPEAVAEHAVAPIMELEVNARHWALVNERARVRAALEADPEWFDAKLAGWWVYGAGSRIGSGWATGTGAWQLTPTGWLRVGGGGIVRQVPHLGASKGVHAQLHHYRDYTGSNNQFVKVTAWLRHLSERLQHLKIASGDFMRVLNPNLNRGVHGVFLDPPYERGVRTAYANYDESATGRANAWCVENGANPRLRAIICGYDDEHDNLLAHGWSRIDLAPGRSYQAEHRDEKAWLSPHCLQPPEQMGLF